ncbi:MAG: hypothetical protein IJO43_01370 [Bacilli bacterium]|nr:hypothetical protein [Bacilli bacterium]
MNVLITNQQESVLANLETEIIKTLRGEYGVDEIISQFSNFFFGKMVLDVTSIKDYKDIVNYQKLSIGLPVDKIILFLPNDPMVTDPSFISKLISMGFYNFGKTLEEVAYLVEHSNTYKDVAHLHQLEPVVAAAPVVVGSVPVPTQAVASAPAQVVPASRVIGFKNVTENAGATTLVYLMKRELETIHGKSVLAIEVNKREFMYFNDSTLVSVTKQDLMSQLLKARNYNIVLVDLNDCDPNVCDEVIYLVEPSILKLNKLMKLNSKTFDKLKGQRVVLNKTLVAGGNIQTFEYETGVKIFDVIRPLDDRSSKPMLTDFMNKLGLIR